MGLKTMSRIPGIAVIGLGVIGVVHVEVLKELERRGVARLIGVYDIDPSRTSEISSKYGCKGYASLKETLLDPSVDVVSIATPHYLHAGQAIMAMEYKKHVIVEKPMATSVTAAREMISRARRNGVRLGVIYQGRYSEGASKLKTLIAEGVLGKILLVVGEMMWWRDEKTYYLKDETARSWRGMWGTEGGGALINQATHLVDLIIWLSGDVEEVFGYIDNLAHPSIDVEDLGIAVMKLRGGGYGSLVANLFTRPERYQYRRLRILGEKGQAELADTELVFLKTVDGLSIEAKGEAKAETISMPWHLHARLFEDFLLALKEDRDFPIDGEEGLKSLETVKAIYYSSQIRQPVKLPLQGWLL